MAILDAEFALLQALMFGDGYGLELIERVKDRTNGEVRIRLNRVYPVLRRLEAEGLLESYDGKPVAVTGGRPRVYYKLTAEGHRVAQRQRAAASGLLQPAVGIS